MHGELTVCSGNGPVFNEGKRTQLSSFFHGGVSVEGETSWVINKACVEEALQQLAFLNQALLHGR